MGNYFYFSNFLHLSLYSIEQPDRGSQPENPPPLHTHTHTLCQLDGSFSPLVTSLVFVLSQWKRTCANMNFKRIYASVDVFLFFSSLFFLDRHG